MENQILKAISHLKNVSKKKVDPLKIFNYMQNNGASNYTYLSIVEKIKELIVKGIINSKYKIIKPITNNYPIVISPSSPVQEKTPIKKTQQPEPLLIDINVTDGSYCELLEDDLNLLDFSNTKVNEPISTFDIGEPILIDFDESVSSTTTKQSNILDTSIAELENFINEKYLETCKRNCDEQKSRSFSKSFHNNSILSSNESKNYGTFNDDNYRKDLEYETIKENNDMKETATGDDPPNLLQYFNEFLIEEVRFLREQISSKNKLIECLLSSSLHDNQNIFKQHEVTKEHQKLLDNNIYNKVSKSVDNNDKISIIDLENNNFEDDTGVDFMIEALNKSALADDDDLNSDILSTDLHNNLLNDIHVNKKRRRNHLVDFEKDDHIDCDQEDDQETKINKVIEEFKKLISDCKDFQQNQNVAKIQNCQHPDEQLEEPVSINSRESDLWKKGTTLIMGDSIVAGLREYKMSRRKMIKTRSFPGARINDMLYYSVPLLKKKPDKIVIHIGTNDAPHLTPEEMLEDLNKLKDMVLKYCPESKIVISTPTLRTDKANSNENNIAFISLLSKSSFNCIHHENILEEHLDRYGLHLNAKGSTVLAKNLLLGLHDF